MSEEQIRRILKRLDEQDTKLDNIAIQLRELQPVKDAFTSVMGFDKVGMWILKTLAIIGAGVGVVYAFVQWLRN